MADPVRPQDLAIVSCAITGGMTVPGQSAAIPCTPAAIVSSAVEAHAAGAAIVHIHVRDPDSGRPTPALALFEDVIAGIADRCDAIVQPTTGGGVGMSIDERARVLTACRPEMASFNVGSFNFGIFQVGHRDGMREWEVRYLEGTRDYVFRNTFADVQRLGELFREADVKPEFEIYDLGHLYNLAFMLSEGWITPPIHLQFVLGVLGACAGTIENLIHMHTTAERLLGQSRWTWSVAGIGYPAEFHLGATALMLGGHLRVGLEDNLRVTRSRRASSNAELVEKAAGLAELLDRRLATATEARAILGISQPAARSVRD